MLSLRSKTWIGAELGYLTVLLVMLAIVSINTSNAFGRVDVTVGEIILFILGVTQKSAITMIIAALITSLLVTWPLILPKSHRVATWAGLLVLLPVFPCYFGTSCPEGGEYFFSTYWFMIAAVWWLRSRMQMEKGWIYGVKIGLVMAIGGLMFNGLVDLLGHNLISSLLLQILLRPLPGFLVVLTLVAMLAERRVREKGYTIPAGW